MYASWQVQTGPTYSDIVTLADLKAYLRVDHSNEDTLITTLAQAAARAIERQTGRLLLTQTWDLFLDRPALHGRHDMPWWTGQRQTSRAYLTGADAAIELTKSPVASITSFVHFDSDNAETTFAASKYRLDKATEPARLVLNEGETWPTNGVRDYQGYRIRCVLGYGADDSSLPDDLKIAMWAQTAHLYENRECAGEVRLSDSVKALIEPFTVLKW